MKKTNSKAKRERSEANKSRFLFDRIVKDLVDLYEKGGMRLGILWVPREILNVMSKASIKRLDGQTLAGTTGVIRTRRGQLRILPLDSDKFHGSEFRTHE